VRLKHELKQGATVGGTEELSPGREDFPLTSSIELSYSIDDGSNRFIV
jgi:hypothetical protein